MANQLDWRYWKATELKEEYQSPHTGNTYPVGTPVAVTTGIQHSDREISFGAPSGPALFLNQAIIAHQSAIAIHPFIVEEWPLQNSTEPTANVFNYLEFIMSSIVFSHTALEAFANELIPDDIQYEEELKSGLLAVRDKEWIERNTSLTQKLGELLPSELGIASPRGTIIWENFVNLRRLRDRIIHLKMIDREIANNENFSPESIWSDLTDPGVSDFPAETKALMTTYYTDELPYWIENSPI